MHMSWAILIYHRLPKGGDGWPWQQLKSALASFFLQKLESSSSQGMSQLFLEEPHYNLHHPDKSAIFASFHGWKSTTDIFVYWFFWNRQQRFILPKRFISQIFRLFLILRLKGRENFSKDGPGEDNLTNYHSFALSVHTCMKRLWFCKNYKGLLV